MAQVKTFQDISMTMLGGAALGALAAFALAFIVVGGMWLFAAAPVVLALTPLIPVIFAAAAWGGAGLTGGIFGIGIAINNLIEDPKDDVTAWFFLGIGLMGTFATAGAILGTFIPVPVLGTLVGASAGAVMGVIIGAAAWALSGIIGAIVIKYKPQYILTEGEHVRVDEDKTLNAQLDNENPLSYGRSNAFYPAVNNDISEEEKEVVPTNGCTIF